MAAPYVYLGEPMLEQFVGILRYVIAHSTRCGFQRVIVVNGLCVFARVVLPPPAIAALRTT